MHETAALARQSLRQVIKQELRIYEPTINELSETAALARQPHSSKSNALGIQKWWNEKGRGRGGGGGGGWANALGKWP